MLSKAQKLLSKLNENSFSAYIVGGAVRDTLLGREIIDVDIATSATFKQVLSVFSDCKCILTGKAHGSITVVFENTPFEITTYRTEQGYSDNRHPDFVLFVPDFETDILRRDFTVNTLAFDKYLNLVDLLGAKSDLDSKIIKSVGNADKRFKEDALRILRAIRFCSELDFSVEKTTETALLENAFLLKNISAERISSEIYKILCGKYAGNAVLKYKGVLSAVLPFLRDIPAQRENKTIAFLKASKADFALRFSSFFIASSENGVAKNAQGAENALSSLRFGRAVKSDILNILSPLCFEQSVSSVLKLENRLGRENLEKAILLESFFCEKDEYKAHLEFARKTLLFAHQNSLCYDLKALCINGSDLKALGFDGDKISKVLDRLICLVLDNKCKNEKNALKKAALVCKNC